VVEVGVDDAVWEGLGGAGDLEALAVSDEEGDGGAGGLEGEPEGAPVWLRVLVVVTVDVGLASRACVGLRVRLRVGLASGLGEPEGLPVGEPDRDGELRLEGEKDRDTLRTASLRAATGSGL
jgi:hypothetical protein